MSHSPHPREALRESPVEILQKLPAMGRLMLSARAGGATHERMGPVGAVALEDGKARLSGDCHDSVIDLSVVTRIVADRTGKMRDRVLPKLECQDAAGETLFSLIGLEGLEPFEAALISLRPGEALEPLTRMAGGMAGAQDVPADDLGAATFSAILAASVPVAIEISRPGLFQHWAGPLPEPKPAMGFVNIMQADFHLHLKAGAVAGWRRDQVGENVVLWARDADGAESGLALRGPAAAFAAVPTLRAEGGRG